MAKRVVKEVKRVNPHLKNIEVHLLVGLPGSGKTYWRNHNVGKLGIKAYYEIDCDAYYVQENGIKYAIDQFFKYNGYDLSRESGTFLGSIQKIIFDNLTLTNEDVKKIIDLFLEHQLTWEGYKIPFKFIIHQWNEDRETCEKNDPLRLDCGELSRDATATATIRYARYEIIDIDALKQLYPDCIFEYEEHIVELHSREEILKEQYNGYIKSERWCIGGDRCNCWGSHWIVDEDEPEQFTEFDNLVKFYCPNISHQDYARLWDLCVDTDSDAEADYYGGCLHYRWYECNLEYLFKKMEEMNVIERR